MFKKHIKNTTAVKNGKDVKGSIKYKNSIIIWIEGQILGIVQLLHFYIIFLFNLNE